MQLFSTTTLATASNTMLNVTAIGLIALMTIPFVLFCLSCWADKRVIERRRRNGNHSELTYSRHRR